MQGASIAPSFRDPAGRVFFKEDRVFRVVNKLGEQHLSSFLTSEVADRLEKAGLLVPTRRVSNGLLQLEASLSDSSLYEHERIAFPSYAYEWPPQMLHAAGVLTLDIAEQCLTEGFGLKDASPYNVLFRGPHPVFVDVLSFERRDPADPTWLAYAQFMRNFSLPLLASERLGTPLSHIFSTRRDGIAPDEIYSWSSPLRRLLPPFLTAISLPVWLSRFESERLYAKRSLDSERSTFILRSLLRRLRRTLKKLQPFESRSTWSQYGDDPVSYTAEQSALKRQFIEKCFGIIHPRKVLDIGCNTGNFSFLAADAGASVVAIDADSVVAGKVWLHARSHNKDVQPLVVDIARPSPALGWRNQETASFLDRARGAFDTVLMLALVHHLLVTERVPLDEIVSLAADLTTRHTIIEFIGTDDPMFRRIARGREYLHDGLTPEVFEDACRRYFEIAATRSLSGCSRTLYLLRKR